MWNFKAVIGCLFLAFAMLVSLAYGGSHEIVVAIEGGKKYSGIYFYGNNVANHDHFEDNLPEHFLRTLEPGERMVEATLPSTSYVVRSSDMRNRVKITIDKNRDSVGSLARPFQLTFTNLAYGDRDGDFPVELQHGSSGFVWLQGGHYVSHSTGQGHRFVIRDTKKEELFSVLVFEMNDKEL